VTFSVKRFKKKQIWAKKAQSFMDQGELVPDKLVEDMVEERLKKSDV